MMKFSGICTLILVFMQFPEITVGQKLLSEGYVLYDVFVSPGNENKDFNNIVQGASAINYVKGTLTRTEFRSSIGNSIIIHDARNGNSVLMSEFGKQKMMIRMNAQNWSDRNKKYQGISFTPTGEKKMIEGYNCIQAKATTLDGTSFMIYYTTELVVENKEMIPMFNELPGLAMEYETAVGNVSVKYVVKRISFDPVPIQKFDIPTSGYRELTYEESIRLNK